MIKTKATTYVLILKLTTYALILMLISSLVACKGPDPYYAPPPPSMGGNVVIPDMNPPMPLPEYPVIDGSSSTMTMHAAIRGYITGGYFTDAHSATYDALERLVPGSDNPADVLLAVRYYDETLQDVENRGANLVITPIAKEGFVFLINADNPIDSLTWQQLRDIYSGKVTNWKEVGGRDEKIKKYTRNWSSGSQTAMEEFMGDVPIAEGDSVPLFSMGTMLDTIGMMGSASIGYNIYSYSMENLADGDFFKLLSVNGIKPSNETLADDSYPLRVYTYSYYNEGNAKGKALTDWLLTEEGQRAIAGAGYVGIFGEMPSNGGIDFNKDGSESESFVYEYYVENGWRFGIDDTNYPHQPVRLTDIAQTEALADGKGKHVTVLYLFNYDGIYTYDAENDSYEYKHARFIVLTREKDGQWEVINEGEVLSYINGVITVAS